MLPNASDLKIFIVVADVLNFSRAAERVGVTQPALSMSIKRLEESFGQTLFLRSRSGVQLTKAGQKLIASARGLLNQWEQLTVDAARDQEEIRGKYVIGAHVSVAIYTAEHYVSQLLQKFKNLEIQFKHDLSRKITEDIVSFKIDFGLVVNPFPHPDLVIRELFNDEVTFWIGPKKNSNNSTKSDSTVLIMDGDLSQSQSLVSKLSKKGIVFNRILNSSNLEYIAKLVSSGAGIGILPTRVAKQYGLKKCNSKLFPVYKDKICLVFRADFNKSSSSRQMSQFLFDSLKRVS